MKGIGREFMEGTKYEHLGQSHQEQGLAPPPLQLAVPASAVLIELPRIEQIKVKAVDLREAIEARRSVREYASTPLTLEELAYLLWCTQGVQRVYEGFATMRTVPSRSPPCFRDLPLINGVEAWIRLYRYVAMGHRLLAVEIGEDLARKVASAALGQQFIAQSAVTFLWVADIYRMTWLYGERGYRYIHLDAGHVCQNLYLASAAIECGVCAMAAFDDNGLNRLLELDGDERFVVYLAAVGKNGAVRG